MALPVDCLRLIAQWSDHSTRRNCLYLNRQWSRIISQLFREECVYLVATPKFTSVLPYHQVHVMFGEKTTDWVAQTQIRQLKLNYKQHDNFNVISPDLTGWTSLEELQAGFFVRVVGLPASLVKLKMRMLPEHPICPQLRQLSLIQLAGDLTQLAGFPRLEKLQIRICDNLAGLGLLTRVRELSLHQGLTSFTSEQRIELASLTQLRSLNIDSFTLTTECPPIQLTHLTLWDSPSPLALSQMTNLTALSLKRVGPADLIGLAALPQLRKLSLAGLTVKKVHLDGLRSIEDLTLLSQHVKPTQLSQLTSLRRLQLDYGAPNRSYFPALATLPRLEQVVLVVYTSRDENYIYSEKTYPAIKKKLRVDGSQITYEEYD